MDSATPIHPRASEADQSSDWEYEYHPTETETFLVDLDVTSINRPVIASNITKAKKGLKLGTNKRITKLSSSRHRPQSRQASVSATGATTPALGDGNETQGQAQIDSASHLREDDEESASSGLQVLDFHTENPIVSYQGNVYSCSWADMVGSTMFFTDHSEVAPTKPEVSTEDYDLIGTTRIKLVGNQANVVPLDQKENTGNVRVQAKSTNVDSRPGASLGDIKTTNSKLNADIRKQAAFLEKLMDAKKARGESDIVRTVASKKIASANHQLGLQTPAKRKKLDELNRKAITGDGEAVKKLKKIYSELDNITSDEGDQSDDSQPPANRPQRSNRTRPVIESSSPSEADEASEHEHQAPVSNDAVSNSSRHGHNSESEID